MGRWHGTLEGYSARTGAIKCNGRGRSNVYLCHPYVVHSFGLYYNYDDPEILYYFAERSSFWSRLELVTVECGGIGVWRVVRGHRKQSKRLSKCEAEISVIHPPT
mmetsp:Transcript_32071/g.48429  ORF Transcript_32071/g.48429 Transcript_32071/m.48429 type:complete len:105 (+) Transcript_32071:123-437(+)